MVRVRASDPVRPHGPLKIARGPVARAGAVGLLVFFYPVATGGQLGPAQKQPLASALSSCSCGHCVPIEGHGLSVRPRPRPPSLAHPWPPQLSRRRRRGRTVWPQPRPGQAGGRGRGCTCAASARRSGWLPPPQGLGTRKRRPPQCGVRMKPSPTVRQVPISQGD